eukprot:CAMPEP_0204164448 /NCGR_PEP_ID=MMETSP0361-20130328/37310_1 /ASSEMBLY_ACC=CAM_ASM_000343 /TAXON_ID=268821 /ORGANISM="Scrippsiella Hangoei, Strain SHTV-5" /LENGTH=33 /DNA_ID= /DNA_START= /DNA_END= /DNA_ORIENTATION=
MQAERAAVHHGVLATSGKRGRVRKSWDALCSPD